MPNPTVPQGLSGKLEFQPTMAGLDAAAITDVKWSQQGAPNHVKFTQPDQVSGVAPGTGDFTCTVACGANDKMTYHFQVECVAMGPPPMPRNVPVTVFVAGPPPPAPPPPPPQQRSA